MIDLPQIVKASTPWNKGKLIGQKPPLKLREIWAIRIRLQLKKIEIVAAVVLLLVALYGYLWVISSSQLAHHFCQGEFSLFHEHFRCRQPYLGLILCVVTGLPSLVLFVIGWRHLKSARENG